MRALLLHRAVQRGATAVEIAVAVAVFGSLLAVAVPAFSRELHASRLVEPVQGLERLGAAAIEYAQGRPVADAFPGSAALTPAVIPRGRLDVEPDSDWETTTWRALHFRAAPEGAPHAFAFAFDSALSPASSRFVAHAHGDLDGDGATSTFEVRGQADPSGAALAPGMYIQAELE